MKRKVYMTVLFVSLKNGFFYGQGECLEDCYAEAKDNVLDNNPSYKKCFKLNDAIKIKDIVDTEKYCVCYDNDDCTILEQKVFFANGYELKTKLLDLYHKGKAQASWIFPMDKAINIKSLEKEFRKNPVSYNRVKEYFGEDW